MADMTIEFLPAADRERLVANGRLSPVSLVRPFSPLEAYPSEYVRVPSWAHVPMLDTVRTSKGTPNYHHVAYLAISQQYRGDAIWTAWTHPSPVARAVLRAWSGYFKPSSDFFGLEPNRSRIDGWRRFFDQAVFGRGLWPGRAPSHPDPPALVLVLGLPLVFAFGLSLCRPRSGGGWSRP